jgi:hypothetical protein
MLFQLNLMLPFSGPKPKFWRKFLSGFQPYEQGLSVFHQYVNMTNKICMREVSTQLGIRIFPHCGIQLRKDM